MMKLINLLICLLVLLPNKVLSQSYWEQVQTPFNGKLNSIFALDTSNVWIAADSGKILYTPDFGETWEIQSIGLDSRIYDIHFIDENRGWGVAWKTDQPPFGTYILSTTDGGQNWNNSFYRNHNVFIYTIFFHDSLNGWIGGSPSELAFTTDGGTNWEAAAIIDTGGFAYFPVHNINFYSPQYGYAVGGYIDAVGVLWRTTNSGNTWEPFGAGPDPIFDIVIFDSLNVLAMMGDIERLYNIATVRTSDGGDNWDYTEINQYGMVTSFSFRNDSEGWATMGYDRYILFSSDTGHTWESYELPDSLPTFGVKFADSTHGMMISDKGIILLYKADEISSSGSNETLVTDFELYQNYPNPFNPSTRISFSLSERSFVSLKVFNSLGQEITVLISEMLEKGFHEKWFDGKELSSGVYLYQMTLHPGKSGSSYKTLSKKMLLLK